MVALDRSLGGGDGAPSNRRGAVGIEWLVAALILSLVIALSTTAVASTLRNGIATLTRAEGRAQAQTAIAILRSELSRSAPGIDWNGVAGDSLRIRAVRGTGWICGTSTTSVAVVFSGDRSPNPTKDSVRIIGADGSTEVRKLRDRRTRALCPGTGLAAELWDLGSGLPREGVLRLFESGTYAIDRGALRYRTGRGGRQPVAGAAFDSTSSLTWQHSTGGPHGGAETNIVLPSGPYRERPLSQRAVLLGRKSLP